MKERSFYCENCGSSVALKATRCADCGSLFDAVKCPSCAFTGAPILFADGCPSCGYLRGRERANRPGDPSGKSDLVDPFQEGAGEVPLVSEGPKPSRGRAVKVGRKRMLPGWAYTVVTFGLVALLILLLATFLSM